MIDIVLSLMIVGCFFGLLLFAALHDLITLTIPNWVSIALAGVFVPAALHVGLGWIEIGIGLGVGLSAMIVGFGLYALHVVGGGDVKLIAAASIWFGAAVGEFLFAIALSGGVLALVWLVLVRMKWSIALGHSDGKRRGLPYAVAIAIGSMWAWPGSDLLAGALQSFGWEI